MQRLAVTLACVGSLTASSACDSENELRWAEGIGRQPVEQTTEPGQRVEHHVQPNRDEVDILFVLDNSSSMLTEQAKLSWNFPIFLDWFTGSDVAYHIGITSMDMDHPEHRGRLRAVDGSRWIDRDTLDAELTFERMVTLGTGGSTFEEGINAAYTAVALRDEGYNFGFRRESASLVVVAISDEDDQSDGDIIDLDGFIDWLGSQEGPSTDVTFISVVTPPMIYGPGAEEPGDRYRQVTDAVGGQSWDIRLEDWSPVLDDLGMRALGMQRSFYLAAVPVPESIQVTVEDAGVIYSFEPEVDWVYDPVGNAVEFIEYLPDAGAVVEIGYTTAI